MTANALHEHALSPALDRALERIRAQFPGLPIEVHHDAGGGVFVVIDGVPLGPPYTEERTWLGFHLSAAYPSSDVYPHYVGPVTRSDGRPHGDGIQHVTWRERPALQLSRRSNRWNPAIDNAALKATKVLAWFLAR